MQAQSMYLPLAYMKTTAFFLSVLLAHFLTYKLVCKTNLDIIKFVMQTNFK